MYLYIYEILMIILLDILYHAKLTDNTQLKYQNPTYNKTFLQLYSAFSDTFTYSQNKPNTK